MIRAHLRFGTGPSAAFFTLAVATAATAQTPPTPPSPAAPAISSDAGPRRQATRAPLDAPLELNGKFLGTVSIEVDLSGEGAIDTKRLVALLTPVLSPTALGAVQARIAGRDKVDFAELSGDGFTIGFDSGALTVRAAVPLGGVAETGIRLVTREGAPDLPRYEPQEKVVAGLNVSAGQRYAHGPGGGLRPLRVGLAGFANVGGFGGVTLTGGADYDGNDSARPFIRREFRATKDFYGSAVRVTAGEFTAASTGFQGSGRVLGLGVERAYEAIRPFQNVRPLGRQSFTLERSSTVEVYINDIRSQTLQLDPGRYDVADFPFASGANRVRLVAQDASGAREIAAFDIFSDVNLLEPGIVEFGAAAGLREGARSLRYDGGPVFSGFLYRGITDNLTLGGHAEATRLGQQVGAIGAIGFPLGFAQIEAAAGRSDEGTGFAVSLDYRGTFSLLDPSDFRAVLSAVYRSEKFGNAFIPSAANPTVLQVAMLAQWRTPVGVGLGLGYAFTMGRGPVPDTKRYDLTLGRSFGRVNLNGTVSRVDEGRRNEVVRDEGGRDGGRRAGWRAAIGLSLQLSPRLYAAARHNTDTGRREVEVSRASTGELGDVSGDVRYDQDGRGQGIAGRVAYINNRFDAEMRHDRTVTFGSDGAKSAQTSWSVSTFIGYADGAAAIGRSAGEGFLIATRHRSLNDSKLAVKSGDRVIARSGLFGPALVPIDRSYGAQRFSFEVDPLPPGYDLGSGAVSIFPGYGAGYRAQVGSDASRVAVGVLTENGKPVPLAGGTVELIGAEPPVSRPFFTNRAGRFVADQLAPGRYRILIGGEPKGEFEIGAKQEGMVDVGTITIRDR